MPEELQNLLQMAMQTTAPVSTQVMTEYAHDSIDTEIGRDNLLTMSQMPERQLVGGVGTGLDALAGFSKAASLIPSIASENLGYILKPFIKTLGYERKGRKIMKRQALEMSKRAKSKFSDPKSLKETSKVHPFEYDKMSKAQSARADNLQDEIKKLQAYEEALKQYSKFGAVRPKTEDYIRKIGPSKENIGSLLEFLKK